MRRSGSMIRSKGSRKQRQTIKEPESRQPSYSLCLSRDNRMVWCCDNASRQARGITKLLRFHSCFVYVIAKAVAGMGQSQESASFHLLVRNGTLTFVLRFRVVLYEIPYGYRTEAKLHFFFISPYVVVFRPSCFISVVCALVIRFLV
jgi:hypothetical protein